MKLRIGFVSNSSSSSYIISYNKDSTGCTACGFSPDMFVGILECMFNCDDGSNIETIEHYVHNLEDEITDCRIRLLQPLPYTCHGTPQEMQELLWREYQEAQLREKQTLLDKIRSYNDPSKKLVVIRISYHDEVINKIFNMLRDKKYIEVIHNYE